MEDRAFLSDNDDDAIEFATYVESDDDDEDPYFMPVHKKKSSTLSFSRLSCSPVQLLRFVVPAICIVIIVAYTIVIAVLTNKKRIVVTPGNITFGG
ncbi:uncharacterized protein BYT42DRAFT_561619 [Radiomyces spectabilis]|uniref:uncharacterized protein n=1 Tax=Radiomyces spectabilis TaxID=64574 RepID=UPI002220D79E|nr:uncharacterized protein BYT42DRAFT_561619 [Radiomyces spectabilis]KAI8388888.1 hypothetical protein BYT42DRAFT_561619 [Radiomyces spectabilis]